MRRTLKHSFFFVSVLFVSSIFGVYLKHVFAGNAQNTTGFVWNGTDATAGGDTAFGWLSFNSRDCDTNGDGTVDVADTPPLGCPLGVIGNYGVNIPASDGLVTGFAWSEHYGFVSFNAADIVGCPIGTCQAERVGNSIVGWARILSIRDAGPNSGGWTGFVSLDSGTTGSVQPYGIAIGGVNLSGYVYSDELGWTDVSAARIASTNTLVVCRLGVPLAQGGETKPLAAAQSSTVSLVTYFDDTPDCAGTDVTAAATFTDTASPVVTLSANGTNPRVVSADQIGNEDVVVTYGGQTATLQVTVIQNCFSNCAGEVTKHCAGEIFPVLDSCNIPEDCTGTRNCDFNLREVAP